ncbi:MAG: RuBisCO chaperone RbcX [Microcoleaceae cyanobacterium]|jgi:RbcX protein
MDIKQVAKDTARVMASYLTYQAVRTIINQLSETNPPLAIWLSNFSSSGKIQDGEVYLKDLLEVNQELAFRVMTVRDYLAEEVTEFLPSMVCTEIKQANIEHRRQHLERLTRLNWSDSSLSPEEDIQNEINLDDPVT